MNPKISIICPVYKAENFLRRCLDSVIAQTYTNWELILVDDGSPDGSGAISDEYARKAESIKVVHKPNGGVSSARNAGLEIATGEWLCFLDSDDWYSPEFLENFLSYISDDVDLVMQGYILENEINNTRQECVLPNRQFATASEVIAYLEGYPDFHNGFLWHRIFRTDIFKKHNICFPDGISFAEDGFVFLHYMNYVRRTIATNAIGYHYRRAEGSLTSTSKKLSDETLHFLIESYLSCLSSIIDLEPNMEVQTKDSLRLYGWRLLQSWVIDRKTSRGADFSSMMEYSKSLIVNYKLTDIYKTSLVHRLLMKACMNDIISQNRILIKILSRLRTREISNQR